MPLPVNFSPWEHFQNVVRKIHNKQVREFFKADLLDDDITSSEGAVRFACLMDDNDTAPHMIARMLFFAIHCGWLEVLLRKVFIGFPRLDFSDKIKPQLTLLFIEKKPYDQSRTYPKEVQISIRIWEKPENITDADIRFLYNKINLLFPGNWTHYCGKIDYSYYDKDSQFRAVIPAKNKSDATELIRKLCDLANVEFSPFKVRKHENEDAIAQPTKTIRILGKTYKKERMRNLGTVKLSIATLDIGHYTQEVIVDRIL
jgi:hypothetical protein